MRPNYFANQRRKGSIVKVNDSHTYAQSPLNYTQYLATRSKHDKSLASWLIVELQLALKSFSHFHYLLTLKLATASVPEVREFSLEDLRGCSQVICHQIKIKRNFNIIRRVSPPCWVLSSPLVGIDHDVAPVWYHKCLFYIGARITFKMSSRALLV